MGCSEGLMVALAVGRSFGAEEGKAQAAAGKVVGVTEGSRTIVVESKLSGQPWIIGAQVTDQTQFGGKAAGLQDVKRGNGVHRRQEPSAICRAEFAESRRWREARS